MGIWGRGTLGPLQNWLFLCCALVEVISTSGLRSEDRPQVPAGAHCQPGAMPVLGVQVTPTQAHLAEDPEAMPLCLSGRDDRTSRLVCSSLTVPLSGGLLWTRSGARSGGRRRTCRQSLSSVELPVCGEHRLQTPDHSCFNS